ncbi:DNA cytosine methyltransferase [Agrobacterium tumefaciens]|uniref:DNA cytosine methyltransferase n=1 Tax=Agrobacterium tumefaciens TaxID=358 RepID=UPI0015724E09|nr:DNA cytosine methyltransferase [Agrobacterium tumefaciens]NTE56080.1 DNA cytosine methyltransferase [Agrobacterium tumefaciens]NTE74209.1 DNA cytosine methyltransferase [Agrobacterium tumefaciens]
MNDTKLTFFEFFAGGGMARAGLGAGWTCVFANDFDFKKGLTYQDNWGVPGVLKVGDVAKVGTEELPGVADLVWASFPCQDLSLAGGGAGLKGERSGTFYPFWDVMKALIVEKRAPRVIALENVVGTLTSHAGKDFEAICATFADNGYRYGALVIDASLFVPQSRPRLFVIGVREDVEIPKTMTAPAPMAPFHTRGLQTAYGNLKSSTKKKWLWWSLPTPARRNEVFSDLVEENPASVQWHSEAETAQLLAMMSDINMAKVEQAKRSGRKMVGGVYKRTRVNEKGVKVQRAEIRFDDVAGCLRTPAGGSSRQVIVVVDGDRVRSRLISARETARLMGLPDEYRLPKNYNEAYHLTGDGVAVPVVRYIAQHIIEPLVRPTEKADSVERHPVRAER